MRERETEAMARFIEYLATMGRGKWNWQPGPDPPDFVMLGESGQERAAVEHTTFIWPRREADYAVALHKLTKAVTEQIKQHVDGTFLLQIDHSLGSSVFDEDFPALAGKNFASVVTNLANVIRRHGSTLAAGGVLLLNPHLRCFLIRQSIVGDGQLYFLHSFELDGTVATDLQRILERKASRLERFDAGVRIVLIDDYQRASDALKGLRQEIHIPSCITEVFIYCHIDGAFVHFDRAK